MNLKDSYLISLIFKVLPLLILWWLDLEEAVNYVMAIMHTVVVSPSRAD